MAVTYFDLHAADRFAQLEHDEDQAWVNVLPAARTGLLSAKYKKTICLFSLRLNLYDEILNLENRCCCAVFALQH